MNAITAVSTNRNFEFPELQRAAQSRDPAATSALIKKLFGVEIEFDYNSHLMDGLFKDYTDLRENLDSLCATRPSYSGAAHKAAFAGALDTLKQTLQLDVKDSRGLKPLHYALLGRSQEAVRYLIDKVDLNELTGAKESYLHFAALSGDPEILRLLLEKGCNASSKNAKGLTAAHYWAARSNQMEGLNMLAEAGAVLHSPNQRQLTPVSILILKALGDPSGPLCWKDLLLLFVNLARMSQMMKMKQYSTAGSECRLRLIDIFDYKFEELNRSILGIFKRSLVGFMTPDDSVLGKLAVSPIGALSAAIADQAAGINLFSLASSAKTAETVLQHANKSLKRCKNASLPMQLLAVPIHLFNSASAIGDTAFRAAPSLFIDHNFLNCAGDVYRKFFHDINDEDEFRKFFDDFFAQAREILKPQFQLCTPVDSNKYKQMHILERLKKDELTQRVSEFAFDEIKKSCFHNFAILLDPNKPPANCEEATSLFHRACKEVHPDKNRAAGAQEAFTKLENIFSSYCPK